MKTIFNKIDPKYIECTSGTCEHIEHKLNSAYWLIFFTAALYAVFKLTKGKSNVR